MKWTDEHIDDLFRKGAEGQKFDYKDAYWQEMESMISADKAIVSEQVSDAEIDALYQSQSQNLSFNYKPEYWTQMEAMLPSRRRFDFAWFFTSLIFLGFIGFQTANSINTNDVDPLLADKSNAEEIEYSSEVVTDTQITNTGETTPQVLFDPIALDLNTLWPNGFDFNNYYQMPSIGGDYYGVDPNNPIGINTELFGQVDPYSGNPNVSDTEVGYLDTKKLDSKEGTLLPLRPIAEGKVKASASFYIQGVAGLSQSLITPSDHLSYSYGLGAGIEIRKRNFTFGFGANVLVSNHNDLHLNRTAKVYGFGSEVYHFDIDYQQLYLTEANLELGYCLNRHTIKVGLRPSYTFSSRVRVSQLDMSYSDNSVVGVEDNRSHYGYMDGLRRFGLKPSVGYAFSIKPGMEIGMNAGMQLMPLVNEDFIDGANNQLPIDAQLYFRKTIRFRK